MANFRERLRQTKVAINCVTSDPVSIYDHSDDVENVVMPVGRFAANLTKRIKDVEKDLDPYNDFRITKDEVVNRKRLSPSQELIIGADDKYKTGPLYLVTFVSIPDPKTGNKVTKELFVNQELHGKLDRGTERNKDPIGNGKDPINDKVYSFHTLGQNWGNMRMRLQDFEARTASAQQGLGDKEASRKPKIGFNNWFRGTKNNGPS